MIAGTAVFNNNCGVLPAYTTKYISSSGTWTAPITGMVQFTMACSRTGVYTGNIKNYIDNLRVYPVSPSLSVDDVHMSTTVKDTANLTLDAGPSYGGKDYIIFTGVTGCDPGFTLTGLDVPLNLDVFTWLAFGMINNPAVFPNFMSTLNSAGQATAQFKTLSATPDALGMAIYFDYILLSNPGKTPAIFASNPVYVLFIP